MAPDASAGCFRMTVLWGFLLSLMLDSALSGIPCPAKQQSPEKCPHVSRCVSKGDSVSIPLNTSETTLDLCMQNGSTAQWDHIYSFVGGGPMKLGKEFQENVSVSQGTFWMGNVGPGAYGNYVLQDQDGKCLAHIELSMGDTPHSPSCSSAHRKGAAAWPWCVISALLLLRWT